jgi:hypothetical protein
MERCDITTTIPEVDIQEDADAMICLEREIVALSERYHLSGDYYEFLVEQIIVTRAILTKETITKEAARAALDSYCRLLCATLGTTAPSDVVSEPALCQTFVALTPALRSLLLFHQPTAGRHRITLSATLVPHVLLTLFLLAAWARQAGMREITYQSITQLCQNNWPLLAMCAYLDRQVFLKPGALLEGPALRNVDYARRYVTIARSLLPAVQRRRRLHLASILAEHSPEDSVWRVACLKLLARQLAGVLIDSERSSAKPRTPDLRVALQRCLLLLLGEKGSAVVASLQTMKSAIKTG